MSVLAHLSIFLNLVTGFLGPVAALIIWLVYRDRSSNVGFQALQSMWYQVAWLVILVAGWTVTTLLMFVLIGFLLVPVMALITLVPFVHSAYAAYRVSKDGGVPLSAHRRHDRSPLEDSQREAAPPIHLVGGVAPRGLGFGADTFCRGRAYK